MSETTVATEPASTRQTQGNVYENCRYRLCHPKAIESIPGVNHYRVLMTWRKENSCSYGDWTQGL
jgi:hypothetical protein